MFREDGSSRGFGFVAFEDPEEAEKAVVEFHGKESPEGKVGIQFFKEVNTYIFAQ